MNQATARPASRPGAWAGRLAAYLGLAITAASAMALAADPYADFLHGAHVGMWAGTLLFAPAACFAAFARLGRRPWLAAWVGFLLPLVCWPLYFQQRFATPDADQVYDYWVLESVEYLPIKRWATRRQHLDHAGALVWRHYIAQETRRVPVDTHGMPVAEDTPSQHASHQSWTCPVWNVTYFGPFVVTHHHWTTRYLPNHRELPVDLAGCTRDE